MIAETKARPIVPIVLKAESVHDGGVCTNRMADPLLNQADHLPYRALIDVRGSPTVLTIATESSHHTLLVANPHDAVYDFSYQ